MKISRLKPLLRALVVAKTRLKRNLLIFIVCCAVKAWWFIRNDDYTPQGNLQKELNIQSTLTQDTIDRHLDSVLDGKSEQRRDPADGQDENPIDRNRQILPPEQALNRAFNSQKGFAVFAYGIQGDKIHPPIT